MCGILAALLRPCRDVAAGRATWSTAAEVSVAMRKWLWPTFRDAGGRRGMWCPDREFVIMADVRS